MDLAGGHEDERSRPDRAPVGSVEELPGTARDHVDLVAVMRLLRVMPVRRIQLRYQAAVGKDRHRQIPRRGRAFLQRLRQIDLRNCCGVILHLGSYRSASAPEANSSRLTSFKST